MSKMNWPTQGENVRLGLAGSFTSGDPSVAIGIYDANGDLRVLLPTERLIIDTLTGIAHNGAGGSVLSAPAGATSVSSSTLLGDLEVEVQTTLIDSKEGVALPVGVTPSLFVS